MASSLHNQTVQSSDFESSETDSMGETSDSELFEMYCPTCLLSYDSEELYRGHYKSDLHLYNVKRKLVNLKPTTQEAFDLRNFQFLTGF